MAEPILEVRSICKIYQMGEVHVNALREVDLDLYAGEFLVLLGPSGSGKSVPVGALFRFANKWCVYIVKSGLVRQGLQVGDVVIQDPSEKVTDGVRVNS